MNIFVTSSNAIKSALALDDVRVNKMIIETAQLLSTAIRCSPGGDKILNGELYAITHRNHPCAVWARESRDNFNWLYEHGTALAAMFRLKTYKIHACQRIIENAIHHIHVIPNSYSTPFVNCTPFKDPKDTRTIYEKYRAYLIDKWNNDIRPPKWSGDNKPDWYQD